MSYLSPIDEYTDFAFRMLCQRYGATHACVPLVNCQAVLRGRMTGVDAISQERDIGVQIVGSDPKAIGQACAIIHEAKPFVSWFNLNCGCPSTRTMGCGGGSAMLDHPGAIIRAVHEMSDNVDVPVSVKLRIKKDAGTTLSLCREIEGAGADSIILHGRTPSQAYRGESDWQAIKEVREGLGIRVIGNGDIKSASQGEAFVESGCCDDFMVGRAAMANPMLFCDRRAETFGEKLALLEEYIEIHRRLSEPDVKDARSKAVNLLSGVRDAARLRDSLGKARTVDEVLGIAKGHE